MKTPRGEQYAVILIAAFFATTTVLRSSWVPPQTAWGAPDLDGVWNYATMTPLERPRELSDKDVLTPADAAAYEKRVIEQRATVNGTASLPYWDPDSEHLSSRRTSLIVDPADGHLPALTPAAQKAAAERSQGRPHPWDGPEDLEVKARCLFWESAGPPMMPTVYNNNVQLIQTKDYVVIFNEMIHDARVVPLGSRPHGTFRRWMGDSVGHWEGQTLVVDTINFTDKTSVRGSDDNLHLTERFTRTSADAIEYRFTVDDQTIWIRPWTALVTLTRTAEPMYEYACHEGNARSVEGMLRGARVQHSGPR